MVLPRQVYGSVMNVHCICKLCSALSTSRMSVDCEKWNGRLFIISDGLVAKIDEQLRSKQHKTDLLELFLSVSQDTIKSIARDYISKNPTELNNRRRGYILYLKY